MPEFVRIAYGFIVNLDQKEEIERELDIEIEYGDFEYNNIYYMAVPDVNEGEIYLIHSLESPTLSITDYTYGSASITDFIDMNTEENTKDIDNLYKIIMDSGIEINNKPSIKIFMFCD